MPGETFTVYYQESGEEKFEGFNGFECERLKKFVAEHDVSSIEFKFSEEIPHEGRHPVGRDYKYVVPKEEIAFVSDEWVKAQRQKMSE